MSDELRLRLKYGTLFGVICLTAAWFGGLVYGAVLLFGFYHACNEWRTISGCAPKPYVWGLVALLAILMVSTFFSLSDFSLFASLDLNFLSAFNGIFIQLICLTAGAAALCFVYASKDKKRISVFGAIYLSWAFYALWYIRLGAESGRFSLFALFFMIWSADSLAYFTGRTFGGPKLAPSISPNKTWSGLAGSMVGAALTAVICSYFYGSVSFSAIIIGAAIGLIGQIGDLGESSFKRHYKVKDSGTLIPGHGGILDRVDGLMAAALFCFVLYALCSSNREVEFFLNLCCSVM